MPIGELPWRVTEYEGVQGDFGRSAGTDGGVLGYDTVRTDA